ncbi:hypothetical protein [Microcoleus sp. herbarium5]|uniref:hypothetical protein n=1 Tax=Microcoleus sp. herbarium5 TaxID=3055434 RepID=UPI002FD13379
MTYSTCLSCTLLSIARFLNPGYVKCDRYIQQALITGNIVRETRLYNKYIPMLVGAGFTDNL